MSASISQRAVATIQNPHPQRLVTDDGVQAALDCLGDSERIGLARARSVLAAAMVKHVEALLATRSNSRAAEQRKADARASEKYVEAIKEEAEAAGEFEKLKAQREHANAVIEAWRSEQANFRGMKV